jgi:hypothetical protein
MADNIHASLTDHASAASAAARAASQLRGSARPPALGQGAVQRAEPVRGGVHGIHAARKASLLERSLDRVSTLFSLTLLAQFAMIPVAFIAGRAAQIFGGRAALDATHLKVNSWATALGTTSVADAKNYWQNTKWAARGHNLPQVNTESVFTTVRKLSKEAGGIGNKAFWGNVRRALPNTSLGHAMMAGMLLTGSAALLLRSGRENTETNDVLRHAAATVYGIAPEAVTKDMLTGASASGFVKNLAEGARKERKGRRVEGAGHLAGNAIFGATLGMGGGMSGMMGVMAGQMAVEQVAEALNEKSTALEGYKVLAMEAGGQGTLSKQNRTKAVKMVIGASPDIAAKGGVHNRLAGLIAGEMIAKDMKLPEILQAANDPRAMASFVAALPQDKVAEAMAPRVKHGKPAAKAPQVGHAPATPPMAIAASHAPLHKPAPMLANAHIMAGGGAMAERMQTQAISRSSGLSS